MCTIIAWSVQCQPECQEAARPHLLFTDIAPILRRFCELKNLCGRLVRRFQVVGNKGGCKVVLGRRYRYLRRECQPFDDTRPQRHQCSTLMAIQIVQVQVQTCYLRYVV